MEVAAMIVASCNLCERGLMHTTTPNVVLDRDLIRAYIQHKATTRVGRWPLLVVILIRLDHVPECYTFASPTPADETSATAYYNEVITAITQVG